MKRALISASLSYEQNGMHYDSRVLLAQKRRRVGPCGVIATKLCVSDLNWTDAIRCRDSPYCGSTMIMDCVYLYRGSFLSCQHTLSTSYLYHSRI